MSRSVRWRSGRSRAPLRRTSSPPRRRSRSSAGENRRSRAAASSIASGNPSSRAQISPTTAAVSSSRPKLGRASRPRSTKSVTAEEAIAPAEPVGSESGGTGRSCSPRTRSPSRLVTRSASLGHCRTSSAASSAAAITCSKLSSTRSSRRGRRCAASASRRSRSPGTARPVVWAIATRTAIGSRACARSTKKTPSSKCSRASDAAWTASRVLPIPPGPVSVTSRTASPRSRRASCSSSAARPTSADVETGRLFGVESMVRGGGNSASRPSAVTW